MENYNKLQEEVRELEIKPKLQGFENKYSDKDYWIEFNTMEFNAICPRTGLPDFAKIILKYKPNKLILESKSMKLYLTAYRNIGIFHEHVINKIFDDFIEAIQPKEAEIMGNFNARGGISIIIKRKFYSRR